MCYILFNDVSEMFDMAKEMGPFVPLFPQLKRY